VLVVSEETSSKYIFLIRNLFGMVVFIAKVAAMLIGDNPPYFPQKRAKDHDYLKNPGNILSLIIHGNGDGACG